MTAVPPGSTVRWAPEGLPVPPEGLDGFSYVVLEEIVSPLGLLRRWPWPEVDQLGRLIWLEDEHDSDAAAVGLELLRAQLYTPNKLSRRPRCGDAFAVQSVVAEGWRAEQEAGDLRELFAGGVYDISADAREAAKFAYHAGLGAVATADTVEEQLKAHQARTLRLRANRPLRALRIADPPRRPR